MLPPLLHWAGGGFRGAVMPLTRDTSTSADAEAIAAQAGSQPELIDLLNADGAGVVG